MKYSFFFLLIAAGFSACKDADVAVPKNTATQELFHDYQIWADDERGEATIRLQYKEGGEDGDPLLLAKGSAVYLDSTPFQLDSARFNGAFYELIKPVSELAGEHQIVLVDERQKKQSESFHFAPFGLANELPDVVVKKPFTVQLTNFPTAATTIRLVMVDTSLDSPDVNEELRVENGEVKIDAAMLANLTKGPTVLQIYREEQRPFENGGTATGRLTTTYGIKREFVLVPQ